MFIHLNPKSVRIMRSALLGSVATPVTTSIHASIQQKLDGLTDSNDLSLTRPEASYLFNLIGRVPGQGAVADQVIRAQLGFVLEQYLADPDQLPAIFMAESLQLNVYTLLPYDEEGHVSFIADNPEEILGVLLAILTAFARRQAPHMAYSLNQCSGQYGDQFYVGLGGTLDDAAFRAELKLQLEPHGYQVTVAPYNQPT